MHVSCCLNVYSQLIICSVLLLLLHGKNLNHNTFFVCLVFISIFTLRCYWGYSFENLATENSIDEDGRGIDANVEFCAVIKTKLGAHRIIMGAEMDCCDATDDGRRFYVELKTSREVSITFFFFVICFSLGTTFI